MKKNPWGISYDQKTVKMSRVQLIGILSKILTELDFKHFTVVETAYKIADELGFK